MLRINTLGRLSVHGDAGPLSGAAAQPRRVAVLALLTRAGERGLTREKIISVLWPDAEEERARRLLTQALYSLRPDLGSEDAIVGLKELRLNRELVTDDAAEFEAALREGALERGAELYVGPFLDGFHLPGCPEFEQWSERERHSLAHDHTEALERDSPPRHVAR